jgi:DNA-binding MarR family transcriptional regulator
VSPADTGSSFDRTANVVGALALILTDRMTDATTDAAGSSSSAATALSALHHFLDGPSIDRLRQVLGLTSSGTVRLVDQLEGAGYVTRRAGADGRSTSVALTAAGRRAARRVSDARAEVLDRALSVLSPAERTQLEAAVSKVLVGLIRGPGAQRWMCRLCDTGVCGHETHECPVTRAVFGPASEATDPGH